MTKRISAVLLALVLLLGLVPALAENPLLYPDMQLTGYAETEDEFINILLLGIDHGFAGYMGSAEKKKMMECHTDAVMVVAVNTTKGTVDLISVPRDTLSYVPGVRGIYKLNAAVNCASTVEEGLENTCRTVSWILGGIKIDGYAALDMEAMVTLCETLGGLEDFYVEMNYSSSTGRRYQKGVQDLDAMGMMDYVRARQNATVNYNDEGRTNRCRQIITAVYKKVLGNLSLINDLWAVANSGKINFFTNISNDDFIELGVAFMKLYTLEVGSYVISGEYKLALTDWNFTFTDQANRRDVIRQVYGVEADDLPYVSYEYTEWLLERGFPVARQLIMAKQLLDYAEDQISLNAAQAEAVEQLRGQYEATLAAFNAAADTMSRSDKEMLDKTYPRLRSKGEAAASKLHYMTDVKWNNSAKWYRDPVLTDHTEIDWR